MPDHAKMMAMHRKHEGERMEMQGRHMKAHQDMAMKHHAEAHAMHGRHEADMMNQSGTAMQEAGRGEAAVAGNTPSGVGGAIGGAGEMAPGSVPQQP